MGLLATRAIPNRRGTAALPPAASEAADGESDEESVQSVPNAKPFV
jgi:hypothetical protein